ncbi:MAG: hypothetical protein ABGY95_03970 [Rubritalea sp.]|uniref:hypothetical protein n=1 Tax=Rubritalea sp. TaxID=2109375 RepID=UPI0032426911
MKSIDYLAIVLFSLFVPIVCVEAQSTDHVLSPTEDATMSSLESVKLSVYAMAYAEGHKKIYLTNSKGETKQVSLSTANILGPYQTALDADSNLILRTQKKTNEGATIYPPIAQVKFPDDIKEPLMILVPSADGQAYEAVFIDRSLESFPKGCYMMTNLSSKEIHGHVGDTKVDVMPDNITLITPTVGKEDLLDVHFEYQSTNQWRTFARTRWVYKKNKRSLLLAFLDPKTKRMRIRGVPLR